MGLGLALWAALAVLRNTSIIGYVARTPGAWELSCLWVFLKDTAIPALATVFFVLCLWLAGRRICRLLCAPSDGVFVVLPGAIGLGLFGTLIFAAGMTGALGAGIRLGLALTAAAGLVEARTFLKTAPWPRRPEKLAPWQAALAALLAFGAFHVLVNALAPPVGWDALAYHLAIPRFYLDADAVRPLPWLLHSHWPHLMEMVYAVPLSLGRESCAALVHALFCAGLVLTVFRVGREEGGAAAGWTAAALLAAQPVFLEVAAEPHCDGVLALFHLLACLALWRWSKEGGKGLLAAAGLCSGLAAACKLQGLALTGALAAWLLFDSRRRAGAAAFLGWAALPAAPWYVKTWLASGNPVWPFYPAIFGGLWNPEHVVQGLERANVWRFPHDVPLLWRYGPQYLLLPAAGLSALAAGHARFPPLLKFLFFSTAPLIALSVRYHEAWRYLTPVLPIVALACGWWCAQACLRPGRLAAAVLLLAFGLSPIAGLTQSNELFAVLAVRSRMMPGVPAAQVYRARQLPFIFFYENAAALIPRGERVLLFQEIRGYHLRADYQWGDPVVQTQIIYDRLESPEALRREMGRQRLSYVIINESRGSDGYYGARTTALMRDMLTRYGRVALRDGPMALYALKPI